MNRVKAAELRLPRGDFGRAFFVLNALLQQSGFALFELRELGAKFFGFGGQRGFIFCAGIGGHIGSTRRLHARGSVARIGGLQRVPSGMADAGGEHKRRGESTDDVKFSER